jgi:hypothetical protein
MAVPWTLYIYDETGLVLKDTVTHADLTPRIHGGFRITVRGNGDCVSLEFRGRNDLLKIYPRYILRLVADGQPLFWGPVVRNPNWYSAGAGPADRDTGSLESYVAEGGRALLSSCSMGNRYIDVNADVGELMRETLVLYGHPALKLDVSQIDLPGAILTRYYKPNAPLDMVFDEITATLPGWTWGVDSSGRVFLRELDGYLQIRASELLNFLFRPVISEDVVTKVNIVVAGAPAGRTPDYQFAANWDPPSAGGRTHTMAHYEYVPLPIVFSYEDPLHAVFRAEKSFALPEGINPFLEPSLAMTEAGTELTNSAAWVNLDNIFDEDATTYASLPAGSSAFLQIATRIIDDSPGRDLIAEQPMVGFRVVYAGLFFPDVFQDYSGERSANRVDFKLQITDQMFSGTLQSQSHLTEVLASYALQSVEVQSGGLGFYSVWNPSAQFDVVNHPDGRPIYHSVNGMLLSVKDTVSEVRLYYFYPLVMNAELLTEIARANLRIPRALPGDAIVRGYSPPVPVVAVEGVFLVGGIIGEAQIGSAVIGDSTVDLVNTVEYLLTTEDGFQTRYVIGNEDISEASKALQKYIDLKQARENYALLMTTRQ